MATVLKQFFRELPEPLVPFDFYEHVVATHSSTTTSADAARSRLLRVVSQLPRANYDVLRYLLQFLHRCSQFAAQNKMTIENLSRVWGTNLMRRRVEAADGGIGDIAHVNAGKIVLREKKKNLGCLCGVRFKVLIVCVFWYEQLPPR